jgi:hypothetical protein
MPFERDFAELERAIERLNTEYAAFLYGSAVKAPVETRRKVEEMLRRLSGADMEAAAERYRLATLQGHFNTLAERWERQQAEKEEGKRPGFYSAFSGAAVRPTAAAGRLSQAAVARESNAGTPGSVQKGERPLPGRELFERYLEAKRSHGEDVSGYEYGQFTENLERERQKVRERIGTDDFDLEVKDSDGRVRLVARRRKPAGE